MSNSNKTYHIEIDPNQEIQDKYIMINLNQSYEFIDILSLKLSLSKLKSYRNFSSDYGIITGRVIANNGVGLPNCRLNLFIPKSSDEEIERQTKNLTFFDKTCIKIGEMFYPFKTPRDLDVEGKQFNILPAFRRFQRQSGFPNNDYGIGYRPYSPLGDFPEKEEVLTNRNAEYVYNKYFKYSTVTNESGDYMMIVPTGSYELVMNCDITDIGPFSVSPKFIYDTKPVNYDDFEENGTKIKENIPPQNAPNIIMQTIPVNIKPLWSNSNDEETGINYQNINILQNITPTALVTGSNIAMNSKSWIGDISLRIYMGFRSLCLGNFGDCYNEDDNCGFTVKLGFYLRVACLTIIRINADKITCDDCNCGTFCFLLKLPPILPFLKIDTSIFSKNNNGVITGVNRCLLGGSSLGNSRFHIQWVDPICYCGTPNEEKILNSIDDPNDFNNACDLLVHETSKLDIKVMSLSENISDEEANKLNIGDIDSLKNIDIVNDIKLISSNQYASIIDNGNFIVELQCNRRKMITSSDGELIDSPDPTKGVFTEFRGYFLVENPCVDGFQTSDLPPTAKVDRVKMKIPTLDNSTSNVGIPYNNIDPNRWICKHFTFKFNEIYSVTQHIKVFNNYGMIPDMVNERNRSGSLRLLNFLELNPFLQLKNNFTHDSFRIIDLPDKDMVATKNPIILNKNFSTTTFENEFLNGCLYFPNLLSKSKKNIQKDTSCETIISYNTVQINGTNTNLVAIRPNKNPLGGNQYNSQFYINSLNAPTNFIKLDKSDYLKFYEVFDRKGVAFDIFNLKEPNNLLSNEEIKYYYKGLNNANNITSPLDSNFI